MRVYHDAFECFNIFILMPLKIILGIRKNIDEQFTTDQKSSSVKSTISCWPHWTSTMVADGVGLVLQNMIFFKSDFAQVCRR